MDLGQDIKKSLVVIVVEKCSLPCPTPVHNVVYRSGNWIRNGRDMK